MSIQEGQTAPAFDLEGHDGSRHRLEDYAGKTVILFFYPKDNTPGCTKEACGFRDHYRALLEKGVVLFGISRDSIKSHLKFVDDFSLPFVLLSDPEAETTRDYDAWGIKKNYGKEYEGVIRSSVAIGPDGSVLKQWKNIRDAAGHPDQVLTWLEEEATL